MKLATFGYTDLKGKKSNRKVLVLSSPTNKLSGIDVTSCTDEEIAEFSGKYEALHDVFVSNIEALKATFDLKHNFRQFLETGIEEIETETL